MGGDVGEEQEEFEGVVNMTKIHFIKLSKN